MNHDICTWPWPILYRQNHLLILLGHAVLSEQCWFLLVQKIDRFAARKKAKNLVSANLFPPHWPPPTPAQIYSSCNTRVLYSSSGDVCLIFQKNARHVQLLSFYCSVHCLQKERFKQILNCCSFFVEVYWMTKNITWNWSGDNSMCDDDYIAWYVMLTLCVVCDNDDDYKRDVRCVMMIMSVMCDDDYERDVWWWLWAWCVGVFCLAAPAGSRQQCIPPRCCCSRHHPLQSLTLQ